MKSPEKGWQIWRCGNMSFREGYPKEPVFFFNGCSMVSSTHLSGGNELGLVWVIQLKHPFLLIAIQVPRYVSSILTPLRSSQTSFQIHHQSTGGFTTKQSFSFIRYLLGKGSLLKMFFASMCQHGEVKNDPRGPTSRSETTLKRWVSSTAMLN